MSKESTITTAKPLVTRKAANKVSKWLKACSSNSEEADRHRAALETAQRWRAQHMLPTENCFKGLLSIADCHPNAVVTSRLKRMTSILGKIGRPNGSYQLGTMDDIGDAG